MKDIDIPDDSFPLLACLPCDPKDWDEAGLVHIIVPKSYTKDTCVKCDREVYLGPVQRQFREKHPDTIINCFICALKVMRTKECAGVASLDGNESCTMFTKSGKVLGKPNPNN